jgi:hypothetical protein
MHRDPTRRIAPEARAAALCALLAALAAAPPPLSSAATYTVTSNLTIGPGTLAQAISDANSNPGPDDIEFAITGVIVLAAPLPGLSDDGTRILGESAADVDPFGPDIEIQGLPTFNGLELSGSNCEVRGLHLNGFDIGIWIRSGATNNSVGAPGSRSGNWIVGNATGVLLQGTGCVQNRVANNRIAANTGHGVWLRSGAWRNTIGGSNPGTGNLVSANGGHGILLETFNDPGTTEPNVRLNRVIGNIVGMDSTGTLDEGNGRDGVRLASPAPMGDVSRNVCRANLVSGNGANGFTLEGGMVFADTINANWIGVDSTAAAAASNDSAGVAIRAGAHENQIGPADLISGNRGDGVVISNPGSDLNLVRDETIGLDLAGAAPLGNGANGVLLEDNSSSTMVTRCLVGGNLGNGVLIIQSDSNTVRECQVGVDRTGKSGLPNADNVDEGGIVVDVGASYNDIGPGNHVAGHADSSQFGICVRNDNASFNHVFGNLVGLEVDQAYPLPNYDGILNYSASSNTYGPGNTSSGNTRYGIHVLGGTSLEIIGNRVGTNAAGLAAFPNRSGVALLGLTSTVGGSRTLGQGNLISGNTYFGITCNSYGFSLYQFHHIEGNDIGLDSAGNPLGNGSGGIWLGSNFWNNYVGDHLASSTDRYNRIAHNGAYGVLVGESGSPRGAIGNRILSNRIWGHATAGIALVGGGNEDITPPAILAATTTYASGVTGFGASVACTVQVFTDVTGQGRVFLGEAASASGSWIVTFPFSIPAGSMVTATNTSDYLGTGYPETSPFSGPVAVSAAGAEEERLPERFAVSRAFPSPARDDVRLEVALPGPARVLARVLDVLGREVARPWDGPAAAGVVFIRWDGRDHAGIRTPPGLYLLEVRADGARAVRRVLWTP